MQPREATAADAGFLVDMLVEAVSWSGERRIARSAVEHDPQLQRYVGGWPRPHDFGVVAVDDDLARIGAAWARTFSAAEPGFGFVADDIPELSLAVVAAHRRSGVGRRLLHALIDVARDRGWRALSLSVGHGNRAAQLYEATGFVTVGRNDTSDIMLLELRA